MLSLSLAAPVRPGSSGASGSGTYGSDSSAAGDLECVAALGEHSSRVHTCVGNCCTPHVFFPLQFPVFHVHALSSLCLPPPWVYLQNTVVP